MSDPEVFEPYIRRMLRDDPSLLQETLSEELEKRALPQSLLPVVMRYTGPLIEELLPAILDQMADLVTRLRAELPNRFGDAAKVGHVKALEREMAPAKKAAIFSNLQFQVYRFREPSLLLGDSMVVFEVRGDRGFQSFLEKDDALVAAILPIAVDAMLVGAAGPYIPDLDRIRLELVRCSREFFITSEKSERNARLSLRIAENAHLLSDREIQEIVRTLLQG